MLYCLWFFFLFLIIYFIFFYLLLFTWIFFLFVTLHNTEIYNRTIDDRSNTATAHAIVICRERGRYVSRISEKRRIVARTYQLRCHSWESLRINSRIARHGAFVLFTLSLFSCHYFFSFRKSVGSLRRDVRKCRCIWLSMIGDHDSWGARHV